MLGRLPYTIAFLALAAVLSARTALAEPPVPARHLEVQARPVSGPIRVDGVLDEQAWREAGVIENLVQQSPKSGEATPFRTEVRFLVDRSTLYIGFVCTDPEPSKIAVHTMQRDANMTGDDMVTVVLDPFGDGRNGYLFRINAAAARVDGLVSGPESTSLDWDGIWGAAAKRTPTGWTAEIAIPAQTLRFTAGRPGWGLEVERWIARVRTTLRWSGTTLDSKLDDLSRAGTLRGLADLKQGLGLSISPYGLGSLSTDFVEPNRTLTGKFGLDVGYNVTPQLNAVVTVNTDFAETEVDTRQVNLTRFPLFFPEKRSFFLEGSDLFVFGLGLGSSFVPFYSRRVGLFEGELVPIDGGVKVLGRAGAFGIGLLGVQTRRTDSVPGTILFAGRLTYDVDSHLRIGTIVTNGDPDGVHSNSVVGLDAVWRTSTFQGDKNFGVGVWGAQSSGDVGSGKRSGWGVKVDYPNDLWDLYAIYKELGDSLEPALGFIPRPGTRSYDLGGAYQPRPTGGPFGWVRQFFFEFGGSLVTDLSNRTQSWEVFTAPFNARTQSGEHLEANWAPQFERLDAPFEISPGVVIPPGSYTFHRFRVEAQSSEHRKVTAGATVWFGSFFDGTLTQISTYLNWRNSGGHLQLGVTAENDYGSLPWGSFITRLYQLRGVYSFTPDLVLSTYVQYDTDTRDLGLNGRLRWTIRPGTDVFLVWNRGWREMGADAHGLAPQAEQVTLKVRWTLRP